MTLRNFVYVVCLEGPRHGVVARKGLIMTTKTLPGEIVTADDASMQSWAQALVARAKADEVELVGTNGLLTALMRTVLQTGMMTHFLCETTVSTR